MREIVLDTETTGLSYEDGHRVIELGCVELEGHVATGRVLQIYFNPETKNVSKEAEQIHGLNNAFLKKQDIFSNRANEFLDFIKNDTLVIHNSKFDLGFLNNELRRCKKNLLENPSIDTIELAKKKLKTGPFNLDALCKKFNIDSSKRTYHGALLDASLLAEVYIELLGGRQADLSFFEENKPENKKNTSNTKKRKDKLPLPKLSLKEIELHKNFIKNIKNPLWSKYTY